MKKGARTWEIYIDFTVKCTSVLGYIANILQTNTWLTNTVYTATTWSAGLSRCNVNN